MCRIEAEVQLNENKETGHCHLGHEHGNVHVPVSMCSEPHYIRDMPIFTARA